MSPTQTSVSASVDPSQAADTALNALISHLEKGTTDALLGIVNETNYGLQASGTKHWQGMPAGKPIPNMINPNDEDEILFTAKGFDGCFAITSYQLMNVKDNDPKNHNLWTATGIYIAIGVLVYSTAISNSKFYVKSFTSSSWKRTSWQKLFDNMDKEENGFVPGDPVKLDNNIKASVTYFLDNTKEHQAMVYKIVLND